MSSIDDPSFDNSREMGLVTALIQAIDDANRDAFTVAVGDYNNMTPLNRAQTSIMVKIKETYLPEDDVGPSPMIEEPDAIDFTGETEN